MASLGRGRGTRGAFCLTFALDVLYINSVDRTWLGELVRFSSFAGYNSFSGERGGRFGLNRDEDIDLDFSSAIEAGSCLMMFDVRILWNLSASKP